MRVLSADLSCTVKGEKRICVYNIQSDFLINEHLIQLIDRSLTSINRDRFAIVMLDNRLGLIEYACMITT